MLLESAGHPYICVLRNSIGASAPMVCVKKHFIILIQNMYTVKEAFNFTYFLLWQQGLSRLVWPHNFMYLINWAVSMVYNYNWHTRSWSHRKDLFNLNKQWQWVLLSRWPIRTVDKFWTWDWTDVDFLKEDACEWACNMNLPDKTIRPCCECNCTKPCKPLDLKQIHPQNQLCAWQYQISWSFVPWMGWFDWRLVKVDLWNVQPELLWMTYYCWPIKLEKYDDIVPLPDSFMPVLWWIIAALVVPPRWAARQQEDLNYYSLYRKELDYLKALDNIYPTEVAMPETTYTSQYPIWNVLASNISLV